MKIHLVILVFCLFTVGARVTLAAQPDQTSNKKNRATQKEQPAPITTFIDNEETANTPNKADENPPSFYASLKKPEGWLVVVGVITCCVIGWQAWETRKAADAAKIGADAAKANAFATKESVRIFISKERARLRVEVGNLSVSVGKNGFVFYTVRHYGPTDAFIVDTKAEAYVSNVLGPSKSTRQYGMGLPDVITPQTVIPERYAQIHDDAFYKMSQAEFNSIDDGDLMVHFCGFIKYRDIFDTEERITAFRYVWQPDILGIKGTWMKCGPSQDNNET